MHILYRGNPINWTGECSMATFTNFATLSYSGGTATSNTVTGELLEAVSAEKNAVVETYSPGEDVTYVLSVLNSGTSDMSGLTVEDDLGGYQFEEETVYPLAYIPGSIRYYINGTLQSPPIVTPGPPMIISGIDVPAGGNAVLVYETEVTAYAPPDASAQIINTAEISGGQIAAPVKASAVVTPESSPNLSVQKSLSPVSVTGNSQITYSFVIENTGSAAADVGDNIVLTDTFNPVLNPISVSFNGTPWTEGTNYTYSPVTGLFSTVAGQITVPAASCVQLADGTWQIKPGTATLVIEGTL